MYVRRRRKEKVRERESQRNVDAVRNRKFERVTDRQKDFTINTS